MTTDTTPKAPETVAEWAKYAEKLNVILNKERADRRNAERQAKDYRAKFYKARDAAELWEYRAIRYSNKINTMNIKRSTERA